MSYALGIHNWDVGLALSAPSVLSFLWEALYRIFYNVSQHKPPFVALVRPPSALSRDIGTLFHHQWHLCRIWRSPVKGDWLILRNLMLGRWAAHNSKKLAAGYAVCFAGLACTGYDRIWYCSELPLRRSRPASTSTGTLEQRHYVRSPLFSTPYWMSHSYAT